MEKSPFEDLKSGATASRYDRYVTPEEIERVIAEAPGAEWRLLIGLARYAGLRIPSESELLTWPDVDWKRCRLTVRSPKTEHHAGHEQRIVPITPKLLTLLHDRHDAMEEGEPRLVTIPQCGATTRRLRDIVTAASVAPWKKLWQTLRSSCEREWAMTLPQYAVSKWIGHSITVSGKHYTNGVPEELFAQASGSLQNSLHEPAPERDCVNPSGTQTERDELKSDTVKTAKNPEIVEDSGVFPAIGVAGFEPTTF